jgi:hypothetical protein
VLPSPYTGDNLEKQIQKNNSGDKYSREKDTIHFSETENIYKFDFIQTEVKYQQTGWYKSDNSRRYRLKDHTRKAISENNNREIIIF